MDNKTIISNKKYMKNIKLNNRDLHMKMEKDGSILSPLNLFMRTGKIRSLRFPNKEQLENESPREKYFRDLIKNRSDIIRLKEDIRNFMFNKGLYNINGLMPSADIKIKENLVYLLQRTAVS